MLRFMARTVLMKYHPQIVGITGSVGKSSTKEAVARVLSAGFMVRKAEGNYNNEVGIPLTIIGAKSGGSSYIRWVGVFFRYFVLMLFPVRYPDILVLEMGVDRPGDMDYLLGFVPVNIGIVTQVSSSHIAYFGSVGNIAREKSRLIAALPEDGFTVLNADDKRTYKMGEKSKAKVLTFGFGGDADVKGDNLLFHREARRVEGVSFKLNYDGKSIPVRLPKVVAKHHIPAVLAAVCVGLAFKMNLVEIASVLEGFEPLPGRMRLLPGRDNTILLDDTYNASPASTEAALEVMREMMAPRKVVVLGDMLELGSESDMEHARLETAVKASGATLVITVGKHMRSLYEVLLTNGYARNQVFWMPDPMVATRVLLQAIRPDDLILIKGSQSMRMETLLEPLLVDPREARASLCRQSDEWRKRPFFPPDEWTE